MTIKGKYKHHDYKIHLEKAQKDWYFYFRSKE